MHIFFIASFAHTTVAFRCSNLKERNDIYRDTPAKRLIEFLIEHRLTEFGRFLIMPLWKQ